MPLVHQHPAPYPDPWHVYVGGSIDKRFEWTDAAGSPIDLTGWATYVVFRDKTLDGAILLDGATFAIGDSTGISVHVPTALVRSALAGHAGRVAVSATSVDDPTVAVVIVAAPFTASTTGA